MLELEPTADFFTILTKGRRYFNPQEFLSQANQRIEMMQLTPL